MRLSCMQGEVEDEPAAVGALELVGPDDELVVEGGAEGEGGGDGDGDGEDDGNDDEGEVGRSWTEHSRDVGHERCRRTSTSPIHSHG